MGSVCEKCQIPISPRIYKDDVILDRKSHSVAGTNTYQDMQHSVNPIRGDIYTRLRPGQRNPQFHTQPMIQTGVELGRFGTNPYELRQNSYGRSQTQNPLHYLQYSQLQSIKGLGNRPIPINHQNNQPKKQFISSHKSTNPEEYMKRSNASQNPNIRVTESRYIQPE